MKKIVIISLLILSASLRLSAEKTAELSMRYSRQETAARIVIEGEDDFIKNAAIAVSNAAIKIDFPAAFEVRKPKDFIFETAKKDRSYYIFLKDITDIKTFRLTGPRRLVFDLKLSGKDKKETPVKPEQRSFQQTGPLVSPGPPSPPWPQKEPVPPAPGPPSQAGQKQQPAPQPVKPPEKAYKKKVIVLDPGHGGYDYGITSEDAREKDVNLILSKDLSAAFAKKGFAVFLDRKVDQSVPLNERINFANGRNPDLFISIHASSGNGYAVYVSALEDINIDSAIKLYSLSSRQSMHLARSREVANSIATNLKTDFSSEVVIRELPLPVLNSLNAPAVMIDYPSLKSYASDQNKRDKFVASILKSVTVHEQ